MQKNDINDVSDKKKKKNHKSPPPRPQKKKEKRKKIACGRSPFLEKYGRGIFVVGFYLPLRDDNNSFKHYYYSRLLITRTFKGNRKKV